MIDTGSGLRARASGAEALHEPGDRPDGVRERAFRDRGVHDPAGGIPRFARHRGARPARAAPRTTRHRTEETR
ncbi:hypothetical protein J5J01_25110 [Streptomyces fradiae]|uniref:hypothetical protein n=1 Tax=Streptomyces fradiae TaxID=1906 RepID=UPI002019B7BF|nr:hypothetical protein [Streptomyces fradiae]UQS30085.1 hypothetical protein J5J01_25110 [Streptomyces fradiae]